MDYETKNEIIMGIGSTIFWVGLIGAVIGTGMYLDRENDKRREKEVAEFRVNQYPQNKVLGITPSEYLSVMGKSQDDLKNYNLIQVIGNNNCEFDKRKLPDNLEAIVSKKQILNYITLRSTTSRGNTGNYQSISCEGIGMSLK